MIRGVTNGSQQRTAAAFAAAGSARGDARVECLKQLHAEARTFYKTGLWRANSSPDPRTRLLLPLPNSKTISPGTGEGLKVRRKQTWSPAVDCWLSLLLSAACVGPQSLPERVQKAIRHSSCSIGCRAQATHSSSSTLQEAGADGHEKHLWRWRSTLRPGQDALLAGMTEYSLTR